MRAYLHIGNEKTGTTSIQEFLRLNRESLSSVGCLTLDAGGFPNAVRAALSCMSLDRIEHNIRHLGLDGCGSTRQAWNDDVWSAIDKEISTARGRCDRMLLSSEYFQTKLETREEIDRLLARLTDAGVSEVRIVVCLRSQLDYAISRYSTVLRAGYAHGSILPTGRRLHALFDYRSLLDRWSEAVGEGMISVVLYDEARARGGVVRSLLEAIGLHADESAWCWPQRRNTALGASAQRVLRAVNAQCEAQSESRESSAGLRKHLVQLLERHGSGAPILPSRADAVAFQSRFDEANRELARRWFDRDVLFDIDYERFPVHDDRDADPCTADLAARLLMELLAV